ncbi:hypothetical protein J2Y03_004210 [Neobacillus niacini]|uniref:hypothetical protein n=1 Tax=Neobacillus niacini TaxID=86668 RepID=UPI002856A8D9|nr:hypothetical protein [Neobacillus niacini]MDR7079153.1 hypothetical protein [Neobacillus niacini]
MRRLRKLSFTLVLISVLISPTFAFATSNNSQESNSDYFQALANYFSFINNDKSSEYYQEDNSINYNYYDKDNKNWWDSLFNWSWGHINEHNDDDWDWDECKDDKWGWGNDNGCIDSTEIWRKWYCY